MSLRRSAVQTFWSVEFSLPIVTFGSVNGGFRPQICLVGDRRCHPNRRVSSPFTSSFETDVQSVGKAKLYGTLLVKRRSL
jgi:hypothetical protein